MNNFIEYISRNDLGHYLENESMKFHTTMRVGGKVRLLYLPNSIESLSQAIKYLHEQNMKFLVIGRGSNLIFSEKTLDVVVIKICKVLDFIEIDDKEVVVGAGYSIAKLAKEVSKLGLSGLEFAGGIPGTVGGSVYMNAGAHTGEIADILENVTYIDKQGNVTTIHNKECDFSYRHSMFQKNDFIIISCILKLEQGDSAAVYKKMAGNLEYRKEMQPLELPSVGSTFRNPPGYHAGKLIEECGLKGHRIGGACVSEKHANFVVNIDDATADDIFDLVDLIKKTVLDKKGVVLQTEFVKVEL